MLNEIKHLLTWCFVLQYWHGYWCWLSVLLYNVDMFLMLSWCFVVQCCLCNWCCLAVLLYNVDMVIDAVHEHNSFCLHSITFPHAMATEYSLHFCPLLSLYQEHCPAIMCMPDEPPWRTQGFMHPASLCVPILSTRSLHYKSSIP